VAYVKSRYFYFSLVKRNAKANILGLSHLMASNLEVVSEHIF
jgi:hypothetical protein